jgi:hypothetical protein
MNSGLREICAEQNPQKHACNNTDEEAIIPQSRVSDKEARTFERRELHHRFLISHERRKP